MPAILFAVFIDLVGFGLIVPILPFIVLTYGGDAFTGTALISVYSLMAFVAGPFWGRMSDRIGRRPSLALTFLGATVSYCVLAFSDQLWLIFLARAMSGATAGNIGIVMASISDMTDPPNRGKVMGWFGAVFGLGFAVGPGLGGLLGSVGGATSLLWPGLAAASLSLTAMVLCLVFVQETNQNVTGKNMVSRHLPWRQIFTEPGQFGLFAMFALCAISQSITFSIMPFWAETLLGWSLTHVGLLMMTSGLMVALIQTFAVGPLFKTFGEVKALMGGVFVQAAGLYIIMTFTITPLIAFIAFPLIMSGLTVSFPALNSLVSVRTDPRQQGAALGFANGISALGRVVGPLSAGALFSSQHASRPFTIVALLAAAVFLWTLWESLQKRDPARTPDPQP